MLPGTRPILKHARILIGRVRRLARPLAWAGVLWAAVAAVPYAFLWPDDGLDRPAVGLLLAAGPVLLGATALSGEALAVLGAGLCGPLPLLVACPILVGPRALGATQGLLHAALALGLIAACWRVERPQTSLWSMLPRPSRLLLDAAPAGLTWALAALFMGIAWFGVALAAADEGARAVRVAAAALCWLAVRRVPLRPDTHVRRAAGGAETWPLRVGRRVAWVGLCGGLLWLWRVQ
ncbi:MAG: hypothetical protein EXR79_02220 [Myxococcales bacterium]|nr:hypothetical protein [Myxococcales bacterium]